MARSRDLRVTASGDFQDLQREFAKGARSAKAWGDEVERSGKRAKASSKDHDHLALGLDRLNVAFGQSTHQTKLFRGSLDLVKPAALITGLGLATEAMSNLSAGAVATTSALAPLSGAIAAYPALASAAGQALGTFKLATNDVAKAVGDLNSPLVKTSQQFKQLTPEGQKFASFVHDDLGPELLKIQTTSQKGLFPGLEKGARDAAKNLPVVQKIVGSTAREMGNLAERAGKLVGSKGFGADLAIQGERNVKWIGRAGTGALHLGNGLRNITLAAGPLVDWMTKLGLRATRWVDAQAAAGRESGRLQRFFGQTRDVMARLVSIGGSLAGAFFNIGKAAAPLGREILAAIDKNAKAFKAWTDSARGQNAIARYFQQAKAPIFELGRLARDATKAFFRLGQGDGVAPLLRQIRTQLLPVLENVVGSTTKAFGPHLINALVQVTRLFGALAGSSGPLTLFVDTVATAAKVLADLLGQNPALQSMVVTFGSMAAIAKALKFTAAISGVKGLATAFKGLRTAAEGAVVAEGAAGTGAAAAGGGGALARLAGVFRSSRSAGIGRAGSVGLAALGGAPGLLLGGLAIGGAYGISQKNVRLGDAASNIASNLVDKTSVQRAQQLAKAGDSAGLAKLEQHLRNIANDSPRLAKNLNATADRVNRLGASVRKIDFGYLRNNAANNLGNLNKQVDINLSGIRQSMGTNTAKGRKAVETNFRLAMSNVKRLLDDGKDHTGTALREIRRLMQVNSGAGADALAANTREAIGTLKRLMAAGVVSTRSGTREIRRLETQALQGFGFDKKSALNITRGNSYTGGPEEGTAGPKATGGWIGAPGMAGGDNIPIVVGAGEAVLNRYQQQPVEMALRSTYGIGLDDLFSQITTPHYMAKGGKVRYASGGRIGNMAATANSIDSKHYPYKWGGGHNDSFAPNGGGYDCSGAVSAVLHSGGLLQHPLVSGQLANFGQPGPGPVTIFANDTHTYMRIGGRYFGTSNSNPGGGAGWFDGSPRPGFTVRHVNAAGGTVKTPKVKGPDSPLKQIVQTALKRETTAANDVIQRAMSSMGQTGGGDWGNFGAPGSGSFGAGALARLWDQAGGRTNYANLMAHVALAESGGNPRAKNPSGATGLWQILGSVVQGNLYNPLVNARNAVSKFNTAWPHPLAPWYSSRGGWGRYVGGLPFARGGRVRGAGRMTAPRFGTGGKIATFGGSTPASSSDTGPDFIPGKGGIYYTLPALGPSGGPTLGMGAFVLVPSGASGSSSDASDPTADLTAAIQANTDALNAAKDELQTQNDFAKSITAVTGREALRALSDVVSGNLGYRTQLRQSTPSAGSVARV